MNRPYFIYLVYLLMAASCAKSNEADCPPPPFFIPPQSLFFQIRQNGKPLDNYSLDWSRLFYIQNGQRIYIDKREFNRAVNEPGSNYMAYDSGVLIAGWSVVLLSADEHIKTFYLEYPNSNSDTLWIDYRHYNNCEFDTSKCKCIYPRYEIRFNGKKAFTNNLVTDQQIYIFNK